ncbi:MAG: hypothetical protein ABIR84_02485 [Candidatus Nitrotoga sp.]
MSIMIAFEIMRGYTIKSYHPMFDSAVIGIDVLNMIDATDYPLAWGNIFGAMINRRVLGDQLVHYRTIGT